MEFRLLGPLEVLGDDGVPIAIGGPRPRALLAHLLLHPGEAISTARLIDGIWGESPPASAQNALQVHVHALRAALGADRIVTRAPGYLLRVEDGELDAHRFEQLVGDGKPREALALWRGAALADVADEPFAQAEAARLDDARLVALEARIDDDLAAGGHAALTAELEALVASHPHRERLRAQQMLSLYRAGRQTDALAAYREARRALDELGLEPSAELRELEQRILRQDADLDAPSTPAAPASASLPAPAGALIGRAREQAAVTALLGRDDVRLVTLTGPGGTGKTRLALSVAGALADGEQRVVFVDLSAVLDPALVLPTVIHALGASEEPGADPVATVAAALGDDPSLLVLDNLEQVVEAAAGIAALLDAAPATRVLATSRGPLRVARERDYPVPPLGVPDHGDELVELERSPAVTLYVKRAEAALPGFSLTVENAGAVARITRALDGLPLALELAAARVRSLGPDGTAARVGERLSLLSRGARDLPERQRSLRATIDWSVELLAPDARSVFAALAAFAGGAALDAVESVADAEVDVPGALDDLLDAALLTRTGAAAEPRFGMLETIREYAAELLAASTDERAVRDRHLAWALHLAEDDVPYWQRPLDAAWLDRIELEHDNMRAALAHARASGDAGLELRLANALRYFWRVRGYVEEGRRRLEEAVELSDRVDPPLRGRTLGEAGVMAFAAGDYAGSRARWSEALPLAEAAGDLREIGRARGELGTCAHAEGDYETALTYYEAARDALADAGDPQSRGVVLANLSGVYNALGDVERATSASLEALQVQEALGDVDGIGFTRQNLASLELARGDLEAAAEHLEVAYACSLEIGYREMIAYTLGIAADLALQIGRHEDAGLLLGAFAEEFRIVGSAPQAEEADRYERVRAALAGSDVDAALARGAALTTEKRGALVGGVVAAARGEPG